MRASVRACLYRIQTAALPSAQQGAGRVARGGVRSRARSVASSGEDAVVALARVTSGARGERRHAGRRGRRGGRLGATLGAEAAAQARPRRVPRDGGQPLVAARLPALEPAEEEVPLVRALTQSAQAACARAGALCARRGRVLALACLFGAMWPLARRWRVRVRGGARTALRRQITLGDAAPFLARPCCTARVWGKRVAQEGACCAGGVLHECRCACGPGQAARGRNES